MEGMNRRMKYGRDEEVYSELSQTSNMELLNVRLGSKYNS